MNVDERATKDKRADKQAKQPPLANVIGNEPPRISVPPKFDFTRHLPEESKAAAPFHPTKSITMG